MQCQTKGQPADTRADDDYVHTALPVRNHLTVAVFATSKMRMI
jgi:hypothetical protein